MAKKGKAHNSSGVGLPSSRILGQGNVSKMEGINEDEE